MWGGSGRVGVVVRGRWAVLAVGVVVVGVVAGCGSGDRGSDGAEPSASVVAETSPSVVVETSASGTAAVPLASGDLQSRWWTWAASEPDATNPVADTDGGACAVNQADDVWFLAGTFGTKAARSCPLPTGVPVAFPVVNRLGAEQDCADFMSAAEGSAVLDGEAVEVDRYAGESVTVTGAEGNPVTAEAGTFTAIGCGLWVQMPALSPGAHTLEIRGSSGDFSVEVDYSLAVAAQ